MRVLDWVGYGEIVIKLGRLFSSPVYGEITSALTKFEVLAATL
jgi:hypothetical protein